MYSRTTISKSLGEQKGICAALQKMITKQTLDLEECREMVHKETLSRKKMEDIVTDRFVVTCCVTDNTLFITYRSSRQHRDAEIEKLKVTNHHMDMELRRLYGIIEVCIGAVFRRIF